MNNSFIVFPYKKTTTDDNEVCPGNEDAVYLPSVRYPVDHPLDGTHLDAVRGLIPTKRFHPSASTKRAQLSVAATTVRSANLFNIMPSPDSMLIRQD